MAKPEAIGPTLSHADESGVLNDLSIAYLCSTKLLQKSEMRKDIVIELSYKGFS